MPMPVDLQNKCRHLLDLASDLGKDYALVSCWYHILAPCLMLKAQFVGWFFQFAGWSNVINLDGTCQVRRAALKRLIELELLQNDAGDAYSNDI